MLTLRNLFAAILVLLMEATSSAAPTPGGSDAISPDSVVLEKANPLHCAKRIAQSYDVNLLVSKEGINITVQKEGKALYSFTGHQFTVFTLFKEIFVYVDYDISLPGGRVIAVDLATGKKLWTAELEAAPPQRHSTYGNIINIEPRPGRVIIRGAETNGNYVEDLDLKTGKQLSHTAVPRPDPSEVKK